MKLLIRSTVSYSIYKVAIQDYDSRPLVLIANLRSLFITPTHNNWSECPR